MALSPQELRERLSSLADEWRTDFKPLAEVVNYIRGEMSQRIFGGGRNPGKNAAGETLPTKPYSTKELYADVRSLPNTPTSFQVGKRGKRIKSAYFPQGYSQLKQVVGRPPLELTNALDLSFTNSPVLSSGANAQITIDDSQSGKVAGLQAKYGVIFDLTQEEELLLGEELSIVITEAINRKLSS